ncbi:hypothetical protein BSK62_23115 [Paenibacillus odorifer]|uniref:MFS transporter n=1 Tax=Paenibacillus TaxID=44249 RepID=UPI00096C6629|nr:MULTISPECIES: MFS transporter [Paenibacillus]MDH6430552.1 putative MFS family arabinose efflux permease [Paenibacillus sp. PastH-4]MDH6443701.1 putative MFS family arabinose efflux permease [Paenibacillus sp. PastF-4]MDH6527610.1 putative MFS family arabinose efflux permease [Paenibacillus sp. PastH-3]OMD62275.1 hypothetical protein BSK62_23115 [Paenibacillus odorifer]
MNSGSPRLYLSSLGLSLLYYPGQSADKQISVFKVLLTPGVIPILVVVLAWMLTHNILYTYISPFLDDMGLEPYLGQVLLVFGIMALVGIWVIGICSDISCTRTLE